MNKLYSVLTSKLQTIPADSYYLKKRSHVNHTYRSMRLCSAMLENVPDDRLPMFACVLCGIVLPTIFGKEIECLDQQNTYAKTARKPVAATQSPYYPADPPSQAECMHDLTLPAYKMKALIGMLDTDIQDRLVVPSWVECMAACCLQLLREIS